MNPAETPTGDGQTKAQKILLVDDNPTNLKILHETLDNLGYHLLVAKHGKGALAIAQKTSLSLILLDIMMPEMDGYEVCERLKADEKTRNIPVIFITALSDDADEARGLDLGAVDYITKPFNPDLVRARVRNHLELKRYRDFLEQLVEERTREIALTQAITIESLATLAEYRDPETGGHIKRTQDYVKALAMHLTDHPRCGYCGEWPAGETMFQKKPYDLVLTDLEMPEMGGYELTREIRRLEKDAASSIIIFAITASDFDLTDEHAKFLGFDGYMLKPLEVDVLEKKLGEIVRKS